MKIYILILTLVGCLYAHAEVPAQPATAAPAVLLIGPPWPTPMEEFFRLKGWQTLRASWGKPFETRFLRQFNVIVLAQYPLVDKNARSNSNLEVTPQFEEQVRGQLQQFVRDGGGLLTFGGDDPMRDRDVVNAFLKPWDIEVLREQVVDPAHTFTQKNGMMFVYLHTDNIEKHPVTRDVRSIFYPTTSIYGLIANPLKAGSAWQPLVRGSEQAASRPIIMDQHKEKVDETRPGSFTTAPLLAAARQAGDGRVAVFGWGPLQTFYQYGHFMVEDIFFTRGGDGKPSDGLKLLEQTLAWLAEPSMKARVADAKQISADAAAVKKLPGLVWWLRADAGVQADANGAVTVWEDQSGLGLSAAQADPSRQPLLVPNALNDKPAVRFDGKNTTLLTGPATLNNDHTVIVVANLGKTPPKTMVLPSLFSYVDEKGSEAGGARLGVAIQADQRVFVGLRYLGTDYWNHSDLAFTPTKPVIVASRRNDGKADVFINGALLKTKDAPGEMTGAPRFFRLGQKDTEPVFFNGDIAEVLVFNTALSESDRAIVEKYLTAKYGVTLFGGYKNEPMREKAIIPDPIVWTAPDLQGKSPEDYWREKTIGDMDATGRWYKGIIGARTKLTGGNGTVAEYAAAARAAKLDFIAFTERVEDISAISKETWDKFRKECQEATGPDLLVLPGQLIQRGEARDWYFRVSDFESPPKRDFLTEDGKRIMNSLYEHFASGLNTLGPLDIRNQPSPHWVSRNYNSMAVTTTKDGQTALDLEPFLYVTQNLDDPKPVALDLITSPDQVAAASKRFVNLRFARSQEELRKQLKTPDNGLPVQISSGPVITNWQGRNQWRRTFGQNVTGTERLLVRLQAKSDRPLAEAIIYDGTKVYRRYKLEGNSCDLFIQALHDQQHQFVAVVKDVDGGMAVAAQMATADLLNRRSICSDRQNSLTSSERLAPDGSPLRYSGGIMQTKYANRGVGPVAYANTVDYVPWMWDGSPGATLSATFEPSMWEAPHILPAKDYQKLIGRMEFPLGSRDVLCQAVGYEYISPNEPPHNDGFWPMEPLKGYNAYARIMEFKKTPDQPAASLIEGYYVMQQDGKWERHDWLWSSFSHMFYSISGRPSSETAWFFVNSAKGEFLSGVAASPDRGANFTKSLDPGGYAAYARGMDVTAFFPLDTPVQVAQEVNQNRLATRIGYDRIGQSYKKGDIIPFRFVSYIGSPSSAPDNRSIEQFRADYGLSGNAPAYSVTPRSGKVLGTRYVLELQAQDGGFGGVIGKAKLETRLPVRVRGVNPNWTSGIIDRAEKWWLPVGVMDDLKLTPEQQAGPTTYSAYAALDLSKDRDVWIGNVVLCDQPDLKLTLLPEGDGRFSIEAHNPTGKNLSATIRTAAEFSLVPPFTKAVEVKAGASALISLAP
jgi:hypothetical protein